ncbi:ribonuclease H-like domain-containing protein [Tanacetum coccineum]
MSLHLENINTAVNYYRKCTFEIDDLSSSFSTQVVYKLVSWSSKKQDALQYLSEKPSRHKHLGAIQSAFPYQAQRCQIYFIKGTGEKGIVELFFVGTEYQLADLFIKAFIGKIGLDDGVAASFQRSRIHKPHAHTQAFKVNRSNIKIVDSNLPHYQRASKSNKESSTGEIVRLIIIYVKQECNKYHSLDHVIGDVQSGVQTRRMTKTTNEQRFISAVYEGKTHKDFHTYLFAYFLSQVEPKKKVWTLVDLPYGKRVIGTKWVYRNKKDERGIVVRNKARLVIQSYTQEEGIDYDEFFALVARIEAIRLFLAYASFMNFVVYQMDVKSAFLYGKIEEKVYVCQPLGFEDPEFPDRVYKVEEVLYGLHQALRAWIFRYLKGQPKLGLWYPRDLPFDLVAYTNSDYAGSSLDRKSTTGGCQFLGCSSIKYALTVNPTVYTTCIEQFWATAKAMTVNGERQIQALVEKKKKKQKPRRKQKKGAEISSSSGEPIIDEAANVASVSTHSNDPLLSGEDRLKLTELMDLCTQLQSRVLALETTKSTQALEIESLKRRVKNLENKKKSRTHKPKRLYKVSLSRRIESSEDDGLEVTLVDETQGRNDEEMLFDVNNDLQGKEVFVEKEVAEKEVSTADLVTTTGEVATTASVEILDELTLAQTLMENKSAKPKAKEKGKAKMVEPEKPLKKKDKILFDQELAARLQAEEQGELTVEEKSRLFVELMNKRKKHFAKLRAEEIRRKPPTKA